MLINAKYLKALLRVAASQDIRYYLNGVLVEATKEGGKFYVATDGHRLGVFHEGWGEDKPEDVSLIIPRGALELWKPGKGKAQLTQVGGRWELLVPGDHGVTFVPIDGKYPEWRRVLPKKVSGEPGDFNVRYLAEFHQISKDLRLPDWDCIVWQNGTSSCVITMDGEKEFVGVLMPKRTGKTGHRTLNLPAWCPQEKEAVAA